MKISLNWIQDFVELKEKNPQKISDKLTFSTSEVEEIIIQKKGLENIIIGEIQKIEKHPDADRMQITQTSVGSKSLQIVCGAKNIRVGQKVPVALIGAILPQDFEIKKAKKRGVDSEGMICSEVELGFDTHSEGIMELPNDAPVGKSIIDYFKLDDIIFDIENTTITNRPDLFSHVGFAKEFAALGLGELKKTNQAQQCTIPKNTPQFPLKVSIESPDLIPEMCGIIIKNFKVQESPLWIMNKLKACNIRPINNLVDITNYVMLELGMPLHAFDMNSIEGKNIKLRTSKDGETIIPLDGVKRKLPKNSIILEDEKKIFDLCGIMGGENSGISDTSHHIWLHAPIYDPIRIRRTSVALDLRSDASIIYEKRVPNCMAIRGMYRALELIKMVSPQSEIASQELQINKDNTPLREITLSNEKISKIIGEDLSEKYIKEVLSTLGFEVTYKNNFYNITVPKTRYKDIQIEEDVIEEIARIHGFDKIESLLPQMQMKMASPEKYSSLQKLFKNLFSSNAYEVLNFSFLGENLLQKINISTKDLIEIANPLSEEHRYLRPSLVPYVLQNIEDNQNLSKSFSLFELGKVFSKNIQTREKTNIVYASMNHSIYSIKGILEKTCEKMNFPIKIQTSEIFPDYVHPGQVGEIFFQGKSIGIIGKIHTSILKNLGIKNDVVFFEINFDVFVQIHQKPRKISNINHFPHIKRDQNFLMNKTELVGNFIKKIKKVPFLQDVEIVDIYEGKQIEDNKKCVTIRATYQAKDTTLTDNDADNSQIELIKLAEKCGAIVRE